MTVPATASPAEASSQQPWRAKILKYASSSVIATVCSEGTFVLMYGALHTSTTWASIVSWLAGALPNYWINRSWTWQRRGRPSLRHEVAPYLTVVLVTLLLATVLTGQAHKLLSHWGVADSARVALVAITFLGVYALMFVLRFFVFDRLFARLERLDAAQPQEAGLD